ncbi:MAG: acetate kinase [Cyanobacteria bacterium K_Offshore_surface_m2_239]|nr:acetate kinase [Cyanobacteria bacterium K_Offshore_surface_m2_239]
MTVVTGGSGPLVLVVNAGSSSLKARLLDRHDQVTWQGQTDWRPDAADAAVEAWLLPALAPWSAALALVGHRVVHGGTDFTVPTRLSTAVRERLAALVPLAPLHNGPALAVMEALSRWRPDLPQWACFDTAFHHTLPPAASTYALPADWRERGLRRFGFHGLNHQHVSEVVATERLISCHLGAGCSLCAIHEGRSVATTMGFTPLEGLVMATRSGSVDPGLLLHLLRQGVEPEELARALNQRSGLLGLSNGLSGSMKTLRAAAAGNTNAALAIAVFRQRLLEGIGAMAACLGGVDVIALTGGIGEHDQALREELQRALAWLPAVTWTVVPADEEGLIARQCRAAAGMG